MITYNIHLINKNLKLDKIISISPKIFILDAIEKHNIKLPYTCKSGACSTCVCKKIKGSINHINQSFLSELELKNNYFLPCVAYATSDLIMYTHMENELY